MWKSLTVLHFTKTEKPINQASLANKEAVTGLGGEVRVAFYDEQIYGIQNFCFIQQQENLSN